MRLSTAFYAHGTLPPPVDCVQEICDVLDRARRNLILALRAFQLHILHQLAQLLVTTPWIVAQHYLIRSDLACVCMMDERTLPYVTGSHHLHHPKVDHFLLMLVGLGFRPVFRY